MKLKIIREGKVLAYWCQGCNHAHTVPIDGSRGWSWIPATQTLLPSVRQFKPAWTDTRGTAHPEFTLCHHWLKNGKLEFLNDSGGHEVRGVHELQDIPENYGGLD
jgi:hypothetical protein